MLDLTGEAWRAPTKEAREVTGPCGLIGSEVSRFLARQGFRVHGIDCSILEAFQMAVRITGRATHYRYVDENRTGDHMCYYSDLRKMKSHHPAWNISKSLPRIFEEIAAHAERDSEWLNKSSA